MRKAKKILAWLIVLGLGSLSACVFYKLCPIVLYILCSALVGFAIGELCFNIIIKKNK